MRTIRRGLTLPAPDRRTAMKAIVLLPLTAVWLRLGGFNRLHATAARFLPQPTSTDYAAAHRTAAVVNAVARRGPYKANCLKRTLVAWWLAGRSGIVTEIRFGVRPGNPPTFHAWIELGGRVVNDAPDIATHYLPFAKPIGRDSVGRFD